ncbi:alpha/beta fold hydrolase [Nonomuraea sp. NPDC050556]|uniref:alpha/beta fold hydrolase n=1 Tax=Nonomuraea sp. NPDC050556 TaxID=3364369 RepID=UPI0037B83286
MSTFTSYDGTELAYRTTGQGEPLLVVPGGPMRDQVYLGDLGGLAEHRTLHLLSLRGTGASGVPGDLGTYRVDRQVADVEAFRAHLGLETADVLGHSAGANLAMLYAAAHPARVAKLALVTPSLRAVGIDFVPDHRREAASLRTGESWYPEAWAAMERVLDGEATEDDWDAMEPFFYGRWDDEIRAFAAGARINEEAIPHYYAEGAMDPEATRAALAKLDAPVLVLAGEYDMGPRPSVAAQAAELFRNGTLTVQPRAGHFPWLDDPAWFTRTVAAFLA